MTTYVLILYTVLNGVAVSEINTNLTFKSLSECRTASAAFDNTDGSASWARSVCVKRTV